MAVKKGLGRGLDILIPKEDTSLHKREEREENKQQEDKREYDIEVDIRKIEPNRDQPRKQFDEDAIEELSESNKQFGGIQYRIVKQKEDYFEIIAGERRWRASKKAGLKKVPVIIKEYDDREILKISLIENLQREDLNPIEEAQAYQKLQEEYNLKQDEIAASVSKSRTAITNTMRLLKLDKRVQKMIMDNLITSGHGRTIIPIEDKELQYETACRILDESLSVREAEQLVKKLLEQKPEKEEKKDENTQKTEMFHFFEGRMKDILGSKVTIKNRKNNKGRIEIEYYSEAELERIIDLIQSIKTDAGESHI